MKQFQCLNDYVEIEPIKREEVIMSQSERFEEMGKIVSFSKWFENGVPKDVKFGGMEIGDVVFFFAHDCWETPEYEGKKHYVVKAELLLGKV